MKPKILTVDDSLSIRIIVKNALRNYNAEIIEAENGEDGFSKALNVKPDLIILDVTMPKMSGTEMLAKLRHDKELKDTPVIMLTAEGNRKIIMEIASLGVRDYIVKPFKEAVFLERIMNVLPLQENAKLLEMPKGFDDNWSMLVVEDKDAIFNELESILKVNKNWTIKRAKNTSEALESLKTNPSHAIFVDLNLEDEKAYKFLSELKNIKTLANSKIFSLLRKNDEEGKSKAHNSGSVGFIYKPIDLTQVNEELKAILCPLQKKDVFSFSNITLNVIFNSKNISVLNAEAKKQFEKFIDEGAKEVCFDLNQLQDADMDTIKILLDLIHFAQELSYAIKIKASEETEKHIKNSYADFGNFEFIHNNVANPV